VRLKRKRFLSIAIIALTVIFFITHEVCLAAQDEGVYVKTGGNVGIGTTTPSYLLQLLKNGSAAPIRLDIHNSGTDNADDSILSFETEGLIEFGIGIDRSTGKFTITKGNTFGTDDFLTIDALGKLGLKNGNAYLNVDDSNNLAFTDSVTGTKTLAELVNTAETDPSVDLEKLKTLVTDDFHTLGGTDANTHIDKDGIEDLGFVAGAHTNDTTLTEAQVDGFVANKGYLKSETDPTVNLAKLKTLVTDDFHKLGGTDANTHLDKAGIEVLGFVAGAHTADTTLTEAQVDGFVANKGYLKSETDPKIGLISDNHVPKWDGSNIKLVDSSISEDDNGNVSINGRLQSRGLRLPYGFGPDNRYVGSDGNYITFGHSMTSEDFIGYKSNTFYLKDSPGGGDESDPNLVVGGNVGIGTDSPQGRLDVKGKIYQRGIVLHADYVFETDYDLESIHEHADFMWKNKHLKAVPKQKADKDGLEIIEVGSHRKGMLEELEKAHIYIEQLHNQNRILEARMAKLESMINVE